MAHSDPQGVVETGDAPNIETAVDKDVVVHHNEFIDTEKHEKVPAKVWLAIGSMALLYQTTLGTTLVLLNVINVINADLGPSSLSTWIASGYTIGLGIGIITSNAVSE